MVIMAWETSTRFSQSRTRRRHRISHGPKWIGRIRHPRPERARL